jgi:hypothetical protein
MPRSPAPSSPRRYPRLIRLIAIATFGAFAAFSDARAAVITVPTDHALIQDAVTVAVAGDTVMILPGTYYEEGSATIEARGSRS